MAEIKVKGADGKPVRYASLDGQNLKLQFEYYARHDNEGDYEVIQTVAPEELAAIANKFGLGANRRYVEPSWVKPRPHP